MDLMVFIWKHPFKLLHAVQIVVTMGIVSMMSFKIFFSDGDSKVQQKLKGKLQYARKI